MKNLSITGNPLIDSLIIRGVMLLAAALGAAAVEWLQAHGFHDPNLTKIVTGAIASAILVVVLLAVEYVRKRADLVRAVEAGIKLAISAQALDAAGKPIVALGAVPAAIMPVTPATAKEIVAAYAGAK